MTNEYKNHRGKVIDGYYYLKVGDRMLIGDELYQYPNGEVRKVGYWYTIMDNHQYVYEDGFTAGRRRVTDTTPTKEELEYLITILEL